MSKNGEKQAINITAISPTTVRAGTFDTLTITGSGFTPDLTIGFRNAKMYDEKYISIPRNHIIYRDNTAFRVLVPSIDLNNNITRPNDGTIVIARTGKIAIMKEGVVKKKSSQVLKVVYAQSTYALNDTSSHIYPVRLAHNTSATNGDFMFWVHSSIWNNNPVR